MKFVVNELCIACGLCAGTCPEVFEMTDDGFARAVEGDVDGTIAETAKEAADACPVGAIETS